MQIHRSRYNAHHQRSPSKYAIPSHHSCCRLRTTVCCRCIRMSSHRLYVKFPSIRRAYLCAALLSTQQTKLSIGSRSDTEFTGAVLY